MSAGSAGKMSLPLIGGTLAIKVCEKISETGRGGGGGHGRLSRLWAAGLEEQAEEGGGHGRTLRLWSGGLEEERLGET